MRFTQITKSPFPNYLSCVLAPHSTWRTRSPDQTCKWERWFEMQLLEKSGNLTRRDQYRVTRSRGALHSWRLLWGKAEPRFPGFKLGLVWELCGCTIYKPTTFPPPHNKQSPRIFCILPKVLICPSFNIIHLPGHNLDTCDHGGSAERRCPCWRVPASPKTRA